MSRREKREEGGGKGRRGLLTMPRTEESKLMSQRRRSSAALRTTGREPDRPRRAAIADMSMAAGGSLAGTGAERERERVAVSALEGRNSGDVGGFGIRLAGKRNGAR
jgi:hypothetical protein